MTTNKNVLRVLKGYMALSSTDKNILIQEINAHNATQNKDTIEKGWKDNIRADVGPTGSDSCPCCGN